MKSAIPDRRVKELIRRYKGGEEDCFASLVQDLSPYIYNYPRIAFCAEPDMCGDFYEYLLERLEGIIKAYRETEAKFVTWFTVVLRNRYLNFMRKNRNQRFIENCYDFLSFDYLINDSHNLYDRIHDDRSYLSSYKQRYDTIVDNIVKVLNKRQRMFFHLYYVETVRPEDIGFLSIFLGMAARDILLKIDQIRDSIVEKYRAKSELLQKLNMLYLSIVKNQELCNRSAVGKLKEKRQKLLEQYDRIKLTPSYESLAQFLSMPLGTISTGVARMKNAVKCYLKEYCHEEVWAL